MTEDTITEAPAASASTPSGTGTEIFLGLLWLGITVWTTHETITGDGDLSGTLGAAVAALPETVSTILLSSAAIAAAASSRFESAVKRLLVGLAVGVAFGLIAALGIRFAYGTDASITALAITIAMASVVGGAIAILPSSVFDAALWSATWVFFAGVIFGVLQPQVSKMIGGGEMRYFYFQAGLTGLLAGYFALQKLSVEKPALLWWPFVGGFGGLLLLASEGLTRVGGASALVDAANANALRQGIIVFAVGAVVCLLRGSMPSARKE